MVEKGGGFMSKLKCSGNLSRNLQVAASWYPLRTPISFQERTWTVEDDELWFVDVINVDSAAAVETSGYCASPTVSDPSEFPVDSCRL